MNAPDIESLLRAAPQPRPPAGLAARLMKDLPASLPAAASLPTATTRHPSAGSQPGHSRPTRLPAPWWLLLLGTGLVAGAAVTTWQAAEIRSLRTQLDTEPGPVPATTGPTAATPQYPSTAGGGTRSNSSLPLEDPRGEIERLKAEISRLRESLPGIASSTINAPAPATAETGTLTADEIAFLDETRAKSQAIVCVNNLKQIGLAVRIYAQDNENKFPPDFDAARSYLGSPKPLHCPGDTTRTAPQDWTDYTSANLSYEYLAPDGSETDPRRVLSRCPVHGTVGLCDGSVFQNTPDKPLKIVNRGGKLYLE